MRYSLPFLRREQKVSFGGCPVRRNQETKTTISQFLMQRSKIIQKNHLWFRRYTRAKEVPFNMSQESQYSFPLIADTADSTPIAALPND